MKVRGPTSSAAQGLGFAIILATFCSSAQGDSANLTYDRNVNRLSVSIATMPADQLLQQIAEIAGIRFRIRGEVGEVRAQAFTDLPLDEAILRLFRSTERGLAVFYQTLPGDGERVAEVRLSARAPAAPRLAKVETVDEAAPQESRQQAHMALPPPPRLPPPPPPTTFR